MIADYFVIASASNQNQVQAMVDNADEMLGRAGYEAKQIEGTRNSSWSYGLRGYDHPYSLMRKTDFSTILRESGETARFLIRKNFLVRMSKIRYIGLL